MHTTTSAAVAARAIMLLLTLSLGFTANPARAQSYDIDTYAGNGIQGYSGDGGPARQASINNSRAVAVDRVRGALYIADQWNHRIRRVDMATGVITTVAGTGAPGYNGDNIAAAAAMLQFPTGMAVNAAGDLLVADTFNRRLRRIDAVTGVISTIAGTGNPGSSGDGDVATAAALTPDHVVRDSAGNLYVSDYQHGNIRRIDAVTGIISTFIDEQDAYALALDAADNLYFTAVDTNRVLRVDAKTGAASVVAGTGNSGYNGDNIIAISAHLTSSFGITIEPDGDVVIADSGNQRIRRVDATTGLISTIAGTGMAGYGGDGGPATAAQIHFPAGMAVDSSGTLYFADRNNAFIRTLAFEPTLADLNVAVDANGNGSTPAGETFSFLAGLQNMGPDDARSPGIGFAFGAVLPDLDVTPPSQGGPFRWTCGPPVIDAGMTSVACTADRISASQDIALFTLSATAPLDRTGQPIHLVAAATSQSSDPFEANNQDSAQLLVGENADLAAAISGPSLLFRTTRSATYRVRASNAGPTDAARTHLKIKASVSPASVQYVPIAGWSCSIANSATFLMDCFPVSEESTLVNGSVANFDLTILDPGRQRQSRIELEASIFSGSAYDSDWENNTHTASIRVVGVARGF